MTASNNTREWRVGTRNSQLALTQTRHIMALLAQQHPHDTFTEVSMTTTGDQILDSPLHQIGSKSLFTKELEVALFDRQVDFVVHSCKDLPTTLPDGLCIGAVDVRASVHDAVVMRQPSDYRCLMDLPDGSVIGTSSVRRSAQLKRLYPHLRFQDIVHIIV